MTSTASAPTSAQSFPCTPGAGPNRREVRFPVGAAHVAAWHYPGDNSPGDNGPGRTGACVVMAGGFAVTKEPATDQFAARLNAAGYGVLAFDYRGIGASGGTPRQVQRGKDMLEDWDAAIAYAAALPGVDPARIALWGFSATGGLVFKAAARHPELAAAIAQTPNAGGLAAGRATMRHQRIGATLRLTARGIADAVGGLFGRAPLLVPLGGRPGELAMIATPDVPDTQAALNPGGRNDDWLQQVAARSVLGLAAARPGAAAGRIRCPLLVMVCEDDQTAYPPAAVAAARRAPRGEVVRLPGGHYAPFLAQHERAVAAQLEFLGRHVGVVGS